MKKEIVGFGVLCLASLCAVSAAEFRSSIYVQGGVEYALLGDWKNAAGPVVAVGTTLPRNQPIEVEVSTVKAEQKTYFWDQVRFTPVLGKYKFIFPTQDQFSLFVAVDAGAVIEKYESPYWSSITDTAAAIGGELGATYAASPSIGISATATSLYVTKTDVTTAGTIGLFSLRMSCRF